VASSGHWPTSEHAVRRNVTTPQTTLGVDQWVDQFVAKAADAVPDGGIPLLIDRTVV